MKDWVKKGLKIMRKTGVCPYCGFTVNGILRLHNSQGECELMSNVKIGELVDSTPPATAVEVVQ
jgi:hypothetical protein